MSTYNYKYSVELYSPSGTLYADLSGKAKNLNITKTRNEPDQITFDLNLDAFEEYCRQINIDPKLVLNTGVTEVRVRRVGVYISGGQLVAKKVSVGIGESTINCRVFGFLWLFKKRYTGVSYSTKPTTFGSPTGIVGEVYTAENGNALSRKDLAWSLIDQTQNILAGSYGITVGTLGGSTNLHDNTYNRTNLYDALTAMTQYQSDPIDIEITADKVFNTYAFMGSNRPDVVFESPGNIARLTYDDDATDMVNEAIVRSQIVDGNQDTRYFEVPGAQYTYALQQEVSNSAADNDDNGAMTNEGRALTAAKAFPIKLPTITVNASQPPYITDYGIGDLISVRVTNHSTLTDVNGSYRLEKYSLDVDENEAESVDLTISNTGNNINNANATYENALIREIQSLRRDTNRINTAN